VTALAIARSPSLKVRIRRCIILFKIGLIASAAFIECRPHSVSWRLPTAASAGLSTSDVCRKHGISSATFYKWKAKFGGLDVSDAKQLKSLEDENAKLKKLLAEAMLDNAMLKDIAAKKW
jgi:putative transposase